MPPRSKKRVPPVPADQILTLYGRPTYMLGGTLAIEATPAVREVSVKVWGFKKAMKPVVSCPYPHSWSMVNDIRPVEATVGSVFILVGSPSRILAVTVTPLAATNFGPARCLIPTRSDKIVVPVSVRLDSVYQRDHSSGGL